MTTRLDALLTRCGYGSRSEAKQLIKSGRVLVDGAPCTQAKRQVENDQVSIDGQVLRLPPACLHVLYHKPVGQACSHDPDEAPLIYDVLPEDWRRAGLESAGRLDRLTSGLLVLSTDGQFLHQLIHPKRKVVKRYRVQYRGLLQRDAVRRCAEGLRLLDDERPCRPATLHPTEEDKFGGRASILLHEGRYHQVRRMFTALGVQVIALHRDRVGALDLPADLGPGEMRELTETECTQLLQRDESASLPSV